MSRNCFRRVQAVGLGRARHGDITHAARRLGLLARSRGDGIEGLDLIAAGTRLSEAERADVIQVGEGFTVRVLDEMTVA